MKINYFGGDWSVCSNKQFYMENLDKIMCVFLNKNFLLSEKCFSSGDSDQSFQSIIWLHFSVEAAQYKGPKETLFLIAL